MGVPTTIGGLRSALSQIGYGGALDGVSESDFDMQQVIGEIEYLYSMSDKTSQDTSRRDSAISHVTRYGSSVGLQDAIDSVSALLDEEMEITPVNVRRIEEDEDGNVESITVDIPDKNVSAGVIKYPPKMLGPIMSIVEEELAKASLWFLNREIKKTNEALGPLMSGKIPLPKISGASFKWAILSLTDIIDALDVFSSDPDLLTQYQTELLRGFVNGMLGNLGMYQRHKLDRIGQGNLSIPSLTRGLKLTLKKAKLPPKDRLSSMDDDELKILMSAFHAVSYSYRHKHPKSARTAALKLYKYLDKKRNADSSGGLSDMDAALRDAHLKRLSEFDELSAYLRGKGYEKSKRKPGAKGRVSVDLPVDLRGIPKSYPVDAYDRGDYSSITLTVVTARASFTGSWDATDKTLEVVIQDIPMTTKQFDSQIRSIESTVKHELEHMMQYIIKDSLRIRKQNEIGVGPVGKSGPWDTAGSPFSRNEKNVSDHKRKEALQRKYPRADDEELYYLTPVEFFPQIESSVRKFLWRVQNPVYGDPPVSQEFLRDNLADMWKTFVGAGYPIGGISYTDTFFQVLKDHDRRLWKRAAAEGYLELKKKVDASVSARVDLRSLWPKQVRTRTMKFGGREIPVLPWSSADFSTEQSVVIVVPKDNSWYGPFDSTGLALRVAKTISTKGDRTSGRKIPLSMMRMVRSSDWPQSTGLGGLSNLHRMAAGTGRM